MYKHGWDRAFSTWTLNTNYLTSMLIDYNESTIQTFTSLVEEKPSRALQPLLMDYIFTSEQFKGFHVRQIRCINSMFKFVGSISANSLTSHPFIHIDRNVITSQPRLKII